MLFYLSLAALLASLTAGLPAALPQEACSTAACQQAAQYIRAAVNESANPCDDFYSYACGGWVASHTIPASKTRTGTFDVLNEQMDNYIKDELYAVNVSDAKQPAVVRFSAHLFHKCMEVANEHDTVGWDMLQQVHLSIFNPIKKISWDNFLGLSWSRASVSPVFSIAIAQDPKNNKRNILNVSHCLFILF